MAKTQVVEAEQVAPLSQIATAGQPLIAGYEIGEQVVVPYLTLQEGKDVYIRIENEMASDPAFAEDEKDKPEDQRTMVCTVTELVSGESMLMVIPAVVKSAFLEKLDGKYVGEAFAIRKLVEKKSRGRTGQTYFTYSMRRLQPTA